MGARDELADGMLTLSTERTMVGRSRTTLGNAAHGYLLAIA
jgi:hypothetical protein